MPALVTDAIVLHVFDYLESSRIVRMVTRDAGMRSALAKGARKSRRRFGSGLDLFGQGTAMLHTRAGRDLDTLSAFEDVTARPELSADLERFAGAETIAEIALQFGRDGADENLFDTIARALDTLCGKSGDAAREATLAAAWQIVATLGFGPATDDCAECHSPLEPEAPAMFALPSGGALCSRCASLNAVGRRLPGEARAAISGWMQGHHLPELGEADARAHQRLLREFLQYHLHDGRSLRAYDMWERAAWSAA